MALTLKSGDQPRSEGVGCKEVGGDEMESVVGDEWLEEGTIESMDEDSISPTTPRFGSPTPSQKRPRVPRPVTLTQGKKRMACGTPAPVWVGAPRGDWTTATYVMVAIAALETPPNDKLATLATAREAREERWSQEMERESVQRRMTGEAKEEWECEQWRRLAEEMNMRKDEIEEVRKGVSALAQRAKDSGTKQPVMAPVPLRLQVSGNATPIQNSTPAPQRRAPNNQAPPPKPPVPATALAVAPEVTMKDVEHDEIE
jgi:hypothetical protein